MTTVASDEWRVASGGGAEEASGEASGWSSDGAAADSPRATPHSPLPPDLRHIDTWVFDLDETLYDRDCGVLQAMEERIEAWLLRGGAFDGAAVRRMREEMRDEHGSTLAALVAQRSTDVDAYLNFVHDIPLEALAPDAALRAAIQRLPGRRLIHTNAPGDHADRVMAALGIGDLFEGVFHCHAAAMALKPTLAAFTGMIAAHTVTPTSACFFEDRAANLKPAAELGMTTVLVGPDAEASTAPWVDYRTRAITPFLQSIRVREAAAP